MVWAAASERLLRWQICEAGARLERDSNKETFLDGTTFIQPGGTIEDWATKGCCKNGAFTVNSGFRSRWPLTCSSWSYRNQPETETRRETRGINRWWDTCFMWFVNVLPHQASLHCFHMLNLLQDFSPVHIPHCKTRHLKCNSHFTGYYNDCGWL